MKAKPTTFAARLQELLDERELSAYRFSQNTGVKLQTLTNFLRGDRQPTFANAAIIAKALGVSLSVFDCVTATMPSPTKKE